MPGQKAPEDQRREEILRAAYTVAARERLTGLTIRQVAAEAGISTGLVFFYFENKDALLTELLDWLLETTIVGGPVEEVSGPREEILATLRRDIEGLPRRRARVELLFDYWVMGTRHPEIQKKVRNGLDRYRETFRPLAERIIAVEPERYTGVTADDLTALITGVIEGCALQVVMDPSQVDVEGYLRTVEALVLPSNASRGWG